MGGVVGRVGGGEVGGAWGRGKVGLVEPRGGEGVE